jgi:Tfp pilus assembly protein PilV
MNNDGGIKMFTATWKLGVAAIAVASMSVLGACASQDSVAKAQSSADQAMQSAQAANQAAQQASLAAQAASDKADRMYQQGLRK